MSIIKRQSSCKQIINYILEQIQKRKLKSGEQLPNERVFAETLGVSRVPLREAISALSLIGILEARQGEGTFINKYNPSILGKIIYTYAILDETAMEEILETRKMLEAENAKLAAKKGTKEDIEKIRIAMEERDQELEIMIDQNPDNRSTFTPDDKFHRAISLATHNHFLHQFLGAISQSVHEDPIARKAEEELTVLKASSEFHHKIFDAIVLRDEDASYRLMYEHVEYVQNYFRTLITRKEKTGL